MTAGKTIAVTRRTFVGKVMSLLFNMLSRFVIAFLPRSKHLLISWLQSPSAVILEPNKIVCPFEQVFTAFTVMRLASQRYHSLCLFVHPSILLVFTEGLPCTRLRSRHFGHSREQTDRHPASTAGTGSSAQSKSSMELPPSDRAARAGGCAEPCDRHHLFKTTQLPHEVEFLQMRKLRLGETRPLVHSHS